MKLPPWIYAREPNVSKYAMHHAYRKAAIREIRRYVAAGGDMKGPLVTETLYMLRAQSAKVRAERAKDRRFAARRDA